MPNLVSAYCCVVCGALHLTSADAAACENKQNIFEPLRPIGSSIQFSHISNNFGFQSQVMKMGTVVAAYRASDKSGFHIPIHVVSCEGMYYELTPSADAGYCAYVSTDKNVYTHGFLEALIREKQSIGAHISY